MKKNILLGALALLTPLALSFAVLPIFADADIVSSNLSLGSSGSEVTALQQFLAQDSSLYPEGTVSGYYGSLTQAAVVRFQVRYSISQTGTVGPITRTKINSLAGGGVSGDVSAPIITNIVAQTTSSTVSLAWTTNEMATTKVYYSLAYPFLYATAPFVANGSLVSTAHNAIIQGLRANTTYYYTLESVDPSGNVTWTLQTPVTTSAI